MKPSPANKLLLTNSPLLHALVLLIAGLLVYSNTFTVPFLFDDIQNIVENRLVTDLRNFFEPAMLLNNRFIGLLSFALNYRLGGMDVTGFHAVNLTVHIANSLLVYRLVLSVFKTPFFERCNSEDDRHFSIALACAASVLFLCHPLQTGAVTYVVQRFTLLATFFFLAALVTYLAARCHLARQGRWQSARFVGLYSTALLSTVFAMKCKEIAFTLPLMIVIAELMFFDARPKTRMCLLFPFLAALAIIPLSLLLLAPSSGGMLQKMAVETNPTRSISRIDYLLNQPRVVLTYIRLLLFPAAQNIDHDFPVYHSLRHLPVMLAWAFHTVCIVLAIVLLRVSGRENPLLRLMSFAILWFYVTLSVESSLIPLDDVIFEHRIYLPSVGFMIIPAACLVMLGKRLARGRGAGMWLVIAAAVVLAGAAYKRNGVWQDAVTLWQDAARKSPLKSRPHYNLGFYLASRGDVTAAIDEFKTAIRLDPDNGKARNNLGALYAKAGDMPAAIREFREAARIEPSNATSHFNLGYGLVAGGDTEAAIAELQKGLLIEPGNTAAREQLRLLDVPNAAAK